MLVNQDENLENMNDVEMIEASEVNNTALETEIERYDRAYRLGDEQKYNESMRAFQQLYNPYSPHTLRKGLCMVADYLHTQQRPQESIDGYRHALYINQAENPEEDLQYYVPDLLEQKIAQIKKEYNLKDYKIAVYAICGNEAHNLEEGFQSMGEADYICVLDTGSTDGSYEILQQYQEQYPEKVFINQKTYHPWRFDVPRNDSLKLVPSSADICICTDPDERLVVGWADTVRLAWRDGFERLYYLYAWSHLANGEPARVFGYDKIHKNSGLWQGKYPIHEALYHPQYGHANLKEDQFAFLDSNYIMLHHYPVYKVTRSNYLPLLEMRYQENPEDLYSNIYLAHEYKYHQEGQKGIDFILQHTLPYYGAHQVESIYFSNIYMFLGDCYAGLNDFSKAEESYQKGIQLDPRYRDTYLHLAQLYIQHQQPLQCIEAVDNCLINSRRYVNGLEGDNSGHSQPGELLTRAYFSLGAVEAAQQCSQLALDLDPENETLKKLYKTVRGAHE